MPAVGPRRGELAELVSDHRLAHEHRHVLFAVVHRDRVPHHLREDRRGPRPGLEHFFVVLRVQRLDPRHQTLFDPRALLARATHLLLPFPRLRPRTMYLLEVLFFLRVRYPSVGTPQGRRSVAISPSLAIS